MTDEFQKLTQEEIDALLEMLPQEPEDPAMASSVHERRHEQQVQLYDFRSPVKFSKEQIWTLQIIHENLAKRLTASLSVYLRSKVQVSLNSVDQGTYAVFIADMPRPTIAHIVSLRPLPGRVILGIGPELATAIIDRMLGGTGHIHARSREATDLELALLRKAVGKILADLVEAWSGIIELEPAIEDVVLNPMFAGVAFPGDAAVLAVFDVFFEKGSGLMNITIPFSALDPVAQELSSGMWARRLTQGTIATRQEFLQQMAAHLAQVNVPLSVCLTTSQLNLDEIAGLRAGDILLLDTRRDGLVRVLVGGQQKFWGRPGTLGNRMAVQIEQVMESGPPDLAIPEGLRNKQTTNDERRTTNDQQPTSQDQYDLHSSPIPSPTLQPGSGYRGGQSSDAIESGVPGDADEQ